MPILAKAEQIFRLIIHHAPMNDGVTEPTTADKAENYLICVGGKKTIMREVIMDICLMRSKRSWGHPTSYTAES